MDDYWNESKTTPSTLDDFFDEESNITWTGSTDDFQDKGSLKITLPQSSQQEAHQNVHSNSLLDNISVHSDSGLTGLRAGRSKSVSKTIGEKIDSWKGPGTSLIWNKSESGSCINCSSKDEEISKLKGRLERTFSKYDITLPPEDTINRIILGLPYSLESYKMHMDKVALLEAALNSSDTSSILVVILFLKKTLKKSLFHKELLKKNVAAMVYVDYLKSRQEHVEAVNILKMLGRYEDAAMLMFSIADASKDNESRVRNFKITVKDYFTDTLSHEAKMVNNYIDLLDRQMPLDAQDSKDQRNQMLLKYPRASQLTGQPLLTTLFYCCKYHWDTSESKVTSPLAFKKHFSINDRQFLWTVLRSRARVNYWPLPQELDALMMPPGLLRTLSNLSTMPGSRRTVKDILPIERVVASLAAINAPMNVISAYILLLPSIDERFKLASLYKCHQAFIDVCIQQRDKEALEKYIKEIPVGSPEYIKAENFIKTMK